MLNNRHYLYHTNATFSIKLLLLKKSKNQDSIIITKFEGFINKIPFSIKAILKSLSFVVEGGECHYWFKCLSYRYLKTFVMNKHCKLSEVIQ